MTPPKEQGLGEKVWQVRFDFDMQLDGKQNSTWGSYGSLANYLVFFDGAVFALVSPIRGVVRIPLAKVKWFQLEKEVSKQ